MYENLTALSTAFVGSIFFWILIFWTAIWKGIALWKSGRNNHLVWFIFILIFNTAGILPIIYLLFFQPKKSIKHKKHDVTKKTVLNIF